MPAIQLFWYMLTPKSRLDYLWKVTVLTLMIVFTSLGIDTLFGNSVRGRGPFYLMNAVLIIIPFLSGGMWLISRLDALQTKLVHLAQTDLLTGLNNRRAFMDQADPHQSGNLVLLDIDHFKRINDTYGHDVGDRVLADVPNFLTQNLRKTDIAARYGGEEFVLYLPDIDLARARSVTERLVAGLQVRIGADDVRVTLSAGVAWLSEPPGLEETLKRADKALYAAKDAGRACFKVWPLVKMAA